VEIAKTMVLGLFVLGILVIAYANMGTYLLSKDYLLPAECDIVEIEKHTEVLF